PLRAALAFGFFVSVMSFLLGVTAIVLKVADAYTVPGWASLAVGLAFSSGVQLSVLGVMGIYVARVHEEVKNRPLYLVRDAVGVPGAMSPLAERASGNSRTSWNPDPVREST